MVYSQIEISNHENMFPFHFLHNQKVFYLAERDKTTQKVQKRRQALTVDFSEFLVFCHRRGAAPF